MGKCFSKDESKGSKAVVPGKRGTSPQITVREVREVRKDLAVAEKPRVETEVAGNGRKLDASLVKKPARVDSLVEVPVLHGTAGLSENSLDSNESKAATQQVSDVQDLRQVSEDVAVLDKDEGAESKVEEVEEVEVEEVEVEEVLSEVDFGLPASLDLGVGVADTPVAELASPPEVVEPEARVHVRRPSMSSTEFAGHFAEFEEPEAKAVVKTAVPALAEKSLPAPHESAELKGEAASAVAVKAKPEGAKLMKAGRPALKDISVNATPKREQALKRQPPKSPVFQSVEAFPVPGAQTRSLPSEIKRSRSAKRSRDWTVVPDDAFCSGGWADTDKHAKLAPADAASTVAAITSNADIASAGPESRSCASLENPEPLPSEGENSISSTLAGTGATIGTTVSPRTPTFGEGWLITSLLLDQEKGNKLESKDVGPLEFPSLDSLGPDVAAVAEGSLGTGKADLDQEEDADKAGTEVEVTGSPSDLAVEGLLQAEDVKSKGSSTSPTEVVPAKVESSCNFETSSLVMPSVASGIDAVSEWREPNPNGHSDLVGIPISEAFVEGGECHNTSAATNLQIGGEVVCTTDEGMRTGDLDCESQEEADVEQESPGPSGVISQNEQVDHELETGDPVFDPRTSMVSKDELVDVVFVDSAEDQLDSSLALHTSSVGLDEGSKLSGSSDVPMQSSIVEQKSVQERDNPEVLPQGKTQSGNAATMADLPVWVEVEVTQSETADTSALTGSFDSEEAVEVLVSTDSSAGLVSANGKTGVEDTHEVTVPDHESRGFQGVGNSEEHSITKSPRVQGNAEAIVSEGTNYYSEAAPSARVDTSASGVCLDAFGSPFKPSVDVLSSEPRNSSQVSRQDDHDVQPPVKDASDGLIPKIPEQPPASASTSGKAPSISDLNVVANQSPSVSNKGPSTTASDNFLVKLPASKKTGTLPAIPRPPRPSKVTDSQLSEAISTLSEKPLRLSSSAPSSPQSAIFDLSQYSLPSTPGDSNARRSSVDSRGSEGPIFDLSQYSLPSTPLSMSNRSTPMSQPSTPMRIGHANAIALTAEEIAEIWGAFEQGTRASSPAPV